MVEKEDWFNGVKRKILWTRFKSYHYVHKVSHSTKQDLHNVQVFLNVIKIIINAKCEYIFTLQHLYKFKIKNV